MLGNKMVNFFSNDGLVDEARDIDVLSAMCGSSRVRAGSSTPKRPPMWRVSASSATRCTCVPKMSPHVYMPDVRAFLPNGRLKLSVELFSREVHALVTHGRPWYLPRQKTNREGKTSSIVAEAEPSVNLGTGPDLIFSPVKPQPSLK